MRPTIFDVADSAGVSYATVSRVVNGHPSVRESTRQRVQEAMLELGYVAHVTARALASGRTKTVGLLAQEIDNPFFSIVIKGIDHEVSAADYDLLLCTTHNRRQKEAEYVARLSHGMVDGLLIVLPTGLPEYVAQLRHERFPFVLVDHDSEAPGCTTVNAANRPGTRAGIAYLIGLGHRRIGFITGRQDVGATYQRLAGYRDALNEAGYRWPTTRSSSRAISLSRAVTRQPASCSRWPIRRRPSSPPAMWLPSASSGLLAMPASRCRATCPCWGSMTSSRPRTRAPRSRPCASHCVRWGTSRCSA